MPDEPKTSPSPITPSEGASDAIAESDVIAKPVPQPVVDVVPVPVHKVVPVVRAKPWMALLIIAVLSIVADQGSKVWARHSLPVSPVGCEVPEALVARTCGGVAVPFIDGVWEWQLAMNLGSAFSMFSTSPKSRVLLSVIGILACFGVGYMLKKAKPHQRLLMYGLALIVGGAIGNLIDRIAFGGVTDFVLWRYKEHRWPIFNIADVVLVVGVVLMLISSWREPDEPRVKKTPNLARIRL